MSALRASLFSTSLFQTHKPIVPSLPFLSRQSFLPLSLCFRSCSSSAAVDTIVADGSETPNFPPHHPRPHPWPEWVTFVDNLKSKGYFVEAQKFENDGAIVYGDMNLLKEPCISFARDRYDLFKLLSMKDIKTIVEHGCPNLLRKSVNSAKRLRVHLQLDEGDVCGTCNLRGLCDRAYVILKEIDGDARTVDIVRVLLQYALDPLILSGGENPPGRGHVNDSVRKLLLELTKLSETSPAPEPLKPSANTSLKKEKEVKSNYGDDNLPQNVEMKRGDWICPKCNFMNFSRNVRCRKCDTSGPRDIQSGEVEMKKGDWNCPKCNFMNFARNIRCLKCKTDGPKRVDSNETELKKGDWICPQCGFMNFSSNRKCLRCPEPRPKRQLNSGDWECPSCDFINFERNRACLKCNCERTRGKAPTLYDDHTWRGHSQ